MTKTPKAYRDDLSKDFGAKRKDTNEKIKRIQDNPDFLEAHKEEAIKVVKDKLYKELDDTRATEEYQGAKSKKQALRGKKKDVKKQEEIVAEQKKLLGDKEAELATMSEEYGEKTEKKESKEKMKIPQLEAKNHKIDEGKSKKEKLAEGWKEEERPAYIDGSETKIKVLKKELAPGAFVREYQDDGKMPKHLVGEQLFNWKAVLSLELQDRLPTWENMVAMRGGAKEEKDNFLKNNFQKDGKNLFPGYWTPNGKKFGSIGERTGCWLSDGNSVGLDGDSMHHLSYDPEFGFSLRLLKN